MGIGPHYDPPARQLETERCRIYTLFSQPCRHLQPEEHAAVGHARIVPADLPKQADGGFSATLIDLPDVREKRPATVESRSERELRGGAHTLGEVGFLVRNAFQRSRLADNRPAPPLRRLEHLRRSECLAQDNFVRTLGFVDAGDLILPIHQFAIGTIGGDREPVLLRQAHNPLHVIETTLQPSGVGDVANDDDGWPQTTFQGFFEPFEKVVVAVALDENGFAAGPLDGSIVTAVVRAGEDHWLLGGDPEVTKQEGVDFS